MDRKSLQGEEQFELSITEVSLSLSVDRAWIEEVIAEGIITPRFSKREETIVDHEAYQKIYTVLKLNRDLGINIQGAAMILDLLEEIDRLRNKLI